ncbi:MAG: glycine zipper 2TM domain-containing protein [Gammaproteobacteria bacterium]
MKKMIMTTLILFSFLATGQSFAGNHYYNQNKNSFYDTAEIIDAKPIYTTERVSVPSQDCLSDDRDFQHRRVNKTGDLIVGGILGGIIGSQFGKGKGKDAMTLAGTLIGSSIAHDGNHDQFNDRHRHSHCKTSHHYVKEERISGYRVTYSYNGETFVTTLNNHPGKQLRVRINVTPTAF